MAGPIAVKTRSSSKIRWLASQRRKPPGSAAWRWPIVTRQKNSKLPRLTWWSTTLDRSMKLASRRSTLRLLISGLALCFASSLAEAAPRESKAIRLPGGNLGWRDSGLGAVRGLTVGPLESAHHPNRGYGTEASALAMRDAKVFGANWVSITPFGRVYDLAPTGVSLSYE